MEVLKELKKPLLNLKREKYVDIHHQLIHRTKFEEIHKKMQNDSPNRINCFSVPQGLVKWFSDTKILEKYFRDYLV